LKKLQPAALILDVLLRSETSWNFLRELKTETNSLPVLVMSVTDDEHKVYGLGADAFLRKPYSPEHMIAEIVRMTSQTPRSRILMIDDNEVSRYLLRGNIPENQYEMFEARDGREGIRMARELKPSLIFLDFYMPDLNGSEVLKDLRSSDALSHTPVILHSTKTLDEADLRFFQENNVAIFSKQTLTLPDSAARLRELMNTLTAHARVRVDSE
jgi:CheY-like chemotaxis protein